MTNKYCVECKFYRQVTPWPDANYVTKHICMRLGKDSRSASLVTGEIKYVKELNCGAERYFPDARDKARNHCCSKARFFESKG